MFGLLAGCAKDSSTEVAPRISATAEISALAPVRVFATGLNNPRGLKFGPDGNLYVAEAGTGGTHLSTLDDCLQVPFPVGPYLGSPTGGRISKINSAGVRTTITDQLPSSQANEIIGGDVEGVADVAFVGNTLYALLAGAGCSHGVPTVPNGVFRIAPNGAASLVANISAYLQANPVLHPEADDFEPDGTPYSMIEVRGDLYAVEPNHGELMKITTSGAISRVIDISASQGHIVPTALAYHGNFYVGNLNTFPIVDGSSKVYKVTPSGNIKVSDSGFTTILGLVFDNRDRMYVLENTVSAPFPTAGHGQVIRVEPSGRKTIIVTGLVVPTGMTLGPDGKLYVSNVGFGPTAIGGGEILQIDVR
ncbi:MAG: hypothetical protein NVS3B25_22070 [Hymenobacter sp.]